MLIFDFDGVLLNSLDEVVVTAYNTVTGCLMTSLKGLPANLIGLFKLNRFHFHSAGDAFLLMNWCLENYLRTPQRILTAKEYQYLAGNAVFSPTWCKRRFFKTRGLFFEKDKEKWFALNAPYQPIWDELIKHGGDRVVILTNKNLSATFDLCHHFGLKVCKKNIYASDEGATKIENLNKIRVCFQQPQCLFIDDSISNLRQIDLHFNQQKKILGLILAAWGYVGPEDESIARTYGYSVFDQKDLIAVLKQELPTPKSVF